MEIKLPKIDIKCTNCSSDNLNYFIESRFQLDINNIIINVDCNNCGIFFELNLKFEDEQTFCNCDLCKKLMVDKGSKVN